MTIPAHGLPAASSKNGTVTLFPHGEEQWLLGGPCGRLGGQVLDSATRAKRRPTIFPFTSIRSAPSRSLGEGALRGAVGDEGIHPGLRRGDGPDKKDGHKTGHGAADVGGGSIHRKLMAEDSRSRHGPATRTSGFCTPSAAALTNEKLDGRTTRVRLLRIA